MGGNRRGLTGRCGTLYGLWEPIVYGVAAHQSRTFRWSGDDSGEREDGVGEREAERFLESRSSVDALLRCGVGWLRSGCTVGSGTRPWVPVVMVGHTVRR